MRLKIGQRYLARDRKGSPTFFFTSKSARDNRLFYKMLREGVITVSPA